MTIQQGLRHPWSAIGIAGGIAGAFIVLGHDGRRVFQLLVLLLPALAWLAWPAASPVVRRVRQLIVWSCLMAFVADGLARAYLLETYQSAPDGALVLGALANTNAREAGEYLSMHWRLAAIVGAALLLTGLYAWRLVGQGSRARADLSNRWMVAGLVLLLLISFVAHASKPWRRLHPVVFWTHWAQSLQALRASWADQHRLRDDMLARAHAAAPLVTREGPSTVMLVITDSINRDNMALYGYGRATTPRLLAHRKQLGSQMLVLRNAWSVDASTLPALRNMFGFGQPDAADAQHLLALARAAGYKVWWMSNHDDLAIEQQHARLAHVVDFVNRVPGRAGALLDGELLDCVQEALEDPAQRKLIVVHLLGAHPHYSLRYPEGQNPFDDEVDAIESSLAKEGRSAWVRRFRQQYDAALLYHDFVVSESLQLMRTVGRTAEHRAWVYLSDHGQEVGHSSDRVGHSPGTASGYRIPAVVWRNEAFAAGSDGLGSRPFRADWLGWTVADLLGMRWKGEQPGRNVLDDVYRWEAPRLPVEVSSFVD